MPVITIMIDNYTWTIHYRHHSSLTKLWIDFELKIKLNCDCRIIIIFINIIVNRWTSLNRPVIKQNFATISQWFTFSLFEYFRFSMFFCFLFDHMCFSLFGVFVCENEIISHHQILQIHQNWWFLILEQQHSIIDSFICTHHEPNWPRFSSMINQISRNETTKKKCEW